MDEKQITEHLINVSVLSELLISEMSELKGTMFWSAGVKTFGKSFSNAIHRQTAKMYKDIGKDAEIFNEQIDVFNIIFDKIKDMKALDRYDLLKNLQEKSTKTEEE